MLLLVWPIDVYLWTSFFSVCAFHFSSFSFFFCANNPDIPNGGAAQYGKIIVSL